MATPIGTYTYNSVISSIRMKLKQFTDEKYPKLTIRDDIYRTISELAELLGTKNDPIYRNFAQIWPRGLDFYGDEHGGITYNLNTNKLYIPSPESNRANVWAEGTTILSTKHVGKKLKIKFLAYAVDGSSLLIEKTVTLTSGNPQNANEAKISAGLEGIGGNFIEFYNGAITSPNESFVIQDESNVLETMVFDDNPYDPYGWVVDISQIPDYKFIDRITSIHDSDYGHCIEVPEKDFRALTRPGMTAEETDYREDILWYRRGGYIQFASWQNPFFGSTRTMFYTRNPIKPTTYTEYVDFPDTQIKLVIDAVVTGILQSLNVQLPQDLASIANKLQAMRQATAEERAKAESNFKTQA